MHGLLLVKKNISIRAKHNAGLYITPSSSPDPNTRPKAGTKYEKNAKAACKTIPLRGKKASAAAPFRSTLVSGAPKKYGLTLADVCFIRCGRLDGYKNYIFIGFRGPPDPLRTPSPGPESTPKGRERGPPAIPNNSRIDAKSKNDQENTKTPPDVHHV
jgi:hypothetical protein